MMHPVDILKMRIQSQSILSGSQNQNSILQMMRTVWAADGLRGFYRGVTPGLTGSLATGATYFGFIESAKKSIEKSHPGLGGHWAHFFARGVGDALGFSVYDPCEVIKQRMQVQGTNASSKSVINNANSVKSNPDPELVHGERISADLAGPHNVIMINAANKLAMRRDFIAITK
ncbi:hypothetical protein Nepgr_015941 [Nepenthes gracilis]|uniref:Uncharacterized protein n=1 Tax=Nepenthes gracilis TaxID=150966 RepID=A0AAD3XS30_NEPGR|nr:hypothetical protein Nepgr_015941 [Nepenthes gracilis]